MNIQEAFISGWTNWNNFTGRASRSEFWFFYLSLTIISIVLSILEMLIGIPGILTTLYQLIIIVPYIAITARRLHDWGISGWWQLSYLTIIGILVIIILCMLPAKEDENKWGRNPLLDM